MQKDRQPPKIFTLNPKPHILIVEARFNEDISDHLAAGVLEVLQANGCSFERLEVPGSLEIPAAINFAVRGLDFDASRRRFDGYIALGSVLKGDTRHDVIVGDESARALQDLALHHCLAIGNGILTCDTHAQALIRARMDGHNRGGAAAEACLRMIEIKAQFRLLAPKRRWVVGRAS